MKEQYVQAKVQKGGADELTEDDEQDLIDATSDSLHRIRVRPLGLLLPLLRA